MRTVDTHLAGQPIREKKPRGTFTLPDLCAKAGCMNDAIRGTNFCPGCTPAPVRTSKAARFGGEQRARKRRPREEYVRTMFEAAPKKRRTNPSRDNGGRGYPKTPVIGRGPDGIEHPFASVELASAASGVSRRNIRRKVKQGAEGNFNGRKTPSTGWRWKLANEGGAK